eukprot:TRINITY_DN26405_c0_g1_i1.p1 TRINITY_DN26405_c0_g1~~TRINITY_DN26405_c0_g1_i1.p1  ORF type:complete len:298 (+),score=94.18 TRINITY_DN26405_c0_g1_i1:34-894(+)
MEGAKSMKKWIEENEESFSPPVCNKLMYGKGYQHKVMFVGGPNVRKDYHMNGGEELFYMVRGEMCLKVMEKGLPKDIVIKEGEIFMLPGAVPHSPQRPNAGSVGLVVERERLEGEMDGVRWFVDDSNTTVLYERWFHCTDLGVQLVPVIKDFFASEEFKTRVPSKDIGAPQLALDTTTTLPAPFSLQAWLDTNAGTLDTEPLPLFDTEFKVVVYGPQGDFAGSPTAECFVWQIAGTSSLFDSATETTTNLKPDDCHVLPAMTAIASRSPDCRLLICQSSKPDPNRA